VKKLAEEVVAGDNFVLPAKKIYKVAHGAAFFWASWGKIFKYVVRVPEFTLPAPSLKAVNLDVCSRDYLRTPRRIEQIFHIGCIVLSLKAANQDNPGLLARGLTNQLTPQIPDKGPTT
jgi:hypothetical protein